MLITIGKNSIKIWISAQWISSGRRRRFFLLPWCTFFDQLQGLDVLRGLGIESDGNPSGAVGSPTRLLKQLLLGTTFDGAARKVCTS